MVFARNIGRLVRPSLLGRCVKPLNGGIQPTPVHAVVSFPSVSLARSIHTPSMESGSASAASLNASTLQGGINDVLGINSVEQAHAEHLKNFEPSVPVESLVARFHELLPNAATTPIEHFEEIFSALADNRAGERSFELLRELKAAGVKPSGTLYSDIVRSMRRALRAHETRELFGEKLRDEEGNYAESPAFASVKEVLAMMEEDGATLSTKFYDDLAHNLSNVQMGGLLLNVATRMEKSGIQPSTYFYNRMLYCLPRCNLVTRADVLFARMVLNNLADQNSYIYRLGSLVYTRRLKEAEVVYKDMNKLYGPHEVACNTMISGYLQAKRVDAALKILEEMRQSDSIKPTSVTANSFIDYYYNNDDLSTAPQVLAYFSQIGFPFCESDSSHLFKLFARRDQPRAIAMLTSIVEKSDKLDIGIYNAILASMMDRLIPSQIRRQFVSILCRDGKPAVTNPEGLAAICVESSPEFCHTLAKMEADAVAPNIVTFDLCMRYMRVRSPDAVVRLFHLLTASPIALQNSHRNMYLEALLNKDYQSEEARAFLKTMTDRRQIIFDYNLLRMKTLGMTIPAYMESRMEAQAEWSGKSNVAHTSSTTPRPRRLEPSFASTF